MQALVVDNRLEDCASLIERLHLNGYETIAVASVRQAREALERQSFDLLLLEFTLPDGNGLQLCDEMRERWGEDGVIIFLSTHDTPVNRVVGLELGADDVVGKPCDLDELLARIEVHALRQRIAGLN